MNGERSAPGGRWENRKGNRQSKKSSERRPEISGQEKNRAEQKTPATSEKEWVKEAEGP
jgi:hypothetical protein